MTHSRGQVSWSTWLLSTRYHIATARGRIAVTDAGSGPTLMLLHGAGFGAAVFRQQFESTLSSYFRMVAIDLPGHGDSDDATDPARDYTISGLADTVTDVLQRLQLGRPVLYGWSLGGHVGIELMARGQLSGLMISGAPPFRKGLLGPIRAFRPRLDMALGTKEHFNGHEARQFYALSFGKSGAPQFLGLVHRADGRCRPAVVHSLMRGACADQRLAVEAATIPLAVVNGADDPLIRLSMFDRLRVPTMWKGAAQVIAGAGHAPFWDQPAIFNARLGAFAHDVADGLEFALPHELPLTG